MNPAAVVYLLINSISLIVYSKNRNDQFLIANNFMFAILNLLFLGEALYRLSQILDSQWNKLSYLATVSQLYGIFLYPKLILMLAAFLLPLLYFNISFRKNSSFQIWLMLVVSINILSEVLVLYLNNWDIIIPGWDTITFAGLGYGMHSISSYVICFAVAIIGRLTISHFKLLSK